MINDLYNKIKGNLIRIALLAVIGVIVNSCANMAAPSGGDYDFDPPVLVKSTPSLNELNVKDHKIEIIFDELITVEKPLEKVIITPPQRNYPVIRAQNHKVIVELRDTLIPNTTYTIDFTDAIVDNNEQNPLENFALTFSTGGVIDSLAISGKVLSADNLEPVAGIYVGIHSDLSDTAFTKKPFLRISRTNELGKFSIKGVAPGKYKIYALNDINRDYKYDNTEESIAFWDSIVVPSFEPAIRYDSIFNKKTLLFDSLKEVSYNRMLPDDIVLRAFTSPFKRQYLQKHERLTDDLLALYFGSPTQMPEIEALDIPVDMKEWAVLEKTAGNDTLKYWLTKPTMVATDTIKLKVSYFITDTLNQLQAKTDTLSFVNRNKKREPQKEEKKKKKDKDKDSKEEEVIYLDIKTNLSPSFEIYKDIEIETDLPLMDFEKEKLQLFHKKDSIFEKIDYTFIEDTLNPRKFTIQHKWKPENEYKFFLDSGSIHTYNGLNNELIEIVFKIPSLDKYGKLDLEIFNLPPNTLAFAELLDKSDSPVRQTKVIDNIATFSYLEPGTYYVRLVLDENNNGKWDPGDYSKGIMPEQVIYYNKPFEIKAFWDIFEDWDILSTPLDQQKPLEITKNKPKDDDKRKRDLERRDARNSKSANRTSSNALETSPRLNNNSQLNR